MKVSIEMCENGWLVIDHEGGFDGQPVRHVYQYDEYGDETRQVKSFVEVLWKINQLVGPSTSRYSKGRVHVSVRRGDKYEPVRNGD